MFMKSAVENGEEGMLQAEGGAHGKDVATGRGKGVRTVQSKRVCGRKCGVKSAQRV